MQKVSKLISNNLLRQDRIALVFPTFTAAAYDYNSFYDFYRKHIDTPSGKNVTKDLNLLSITVTNEISPEASGNSMLFMIKNLEQTIPNLNLHVLSDQDVDSGCIFANNGSKLRCYNFRSSRYVTQRE